ncbi:unnamed protein product [Discula destructiva]
MASIEVGIEAFNAFLQANVTGPVLTESQAQLAQPYADNVDLRLASLDVDGVSVYPFIPHIDLFCLAKHVLENVATPESWNASPSSTATGISLLWMRLRLLVWHYKLFILPSLSGAAFTKHAGMSEVPTLVEHIQNALASVEADVVGEAWELASSGAAKWTEEEQVRFLVEKANVCIMLGHETAARDALRRATDTHGFSYALSGALGKRTRFQEKSTSQLVVIARSRTDLDAQAQDEKEQVPEALPLNDDTLLEEIKYGGEGLHGEVDAGVKTLPAELRGLKPDDQPPLTPLDQIILLTEATLKDAFSPIDALTSEEILPFAVRVIVDKGANWQIYTQALLVRSRIEMHRSRTVERGVLQMQAVVDQVLVDTAVKRSDGTEKPEAEPSVPVISVSDPDEAPKDKRDREEAAPVAENPVSFFRTGKSTDSAPASTRLEYIHALSSPPRWHLESELAYAWTGVGSLISALEIFKRLKLWAEVALCFASSASTDNDDGSGRGGGGEDKARAIIRWRLFHRKTDTTNGQAGDDINEEMDITTLKAMDYTGAERTPPQPNAPRLFCILGDIESESAVAHYERAWEISKYRYARAQKSLAEHYLVQKDWIKAREAYQLAVSVNRLSPEMWSRLGDINLRLGEFEDAAESFTRAIGSSNDTAGGEDARTWSNLGSALYSMYQEVIEKVRDAQVNGDNEPSNASGIKADDEEDDEPLCATKTTKSPSIILAQAMNAYKRGASIAHDNWRIWDNVITLAARMQPMPFFEIIQALRAIIRIRKTEEALDADILRLLLAEGVQSKDIGPGEGVYEPPRGSVERNMNEMLENEIVPLITHRSELWELLSRLRLWRRDLTGAVDASEKAWRAAVGGAGSALSVDDAKKDEAAASRNWLENEEAWKVVVQRTEELVAMLETQGPRVPEIGEKWRGRARSAVRSVMGKGKEPWEGTEGWETLKGLLEGLKV